MLDGSVRILNLDNSVVSQTEILQQFRPAIVDCTDISASCRLWANRKTACKIKERLTPELKGAITFLGSGDFHHISGFLLEQFQEPLTVIVFDHHPDWDILPPRWGCGSWVTTILKRQNIKKVILLGVSSEDISSLEVQTGNLGSLRDNRVEIYPYLHRPTAALCKKVPDDTVSIKVTRGLFCSRIHWRQLRTENLTGLFWEIVKRLEMKQVYVSIDKDCLTSRYSLTNWEAGYFDLEELLLLLRLIKENLDIVGLDIVGDYSLPRTRGVFKAFFSRLDHPRHYSARGHSASTIGMVNGCTNRKILELLRT